MKRILALVLALLMMLSLCACGNESAGNSDAWEISWWIPTGEDAAFYAEYEDNPILIWIEQNMTFNGKPIDFDFVTGAPGGQADEWSRLIGTGDYCDIMDLSMASMTASELYAEGLIWDITALVEEHMPNLMAYMEANPEMKDYLYTRVNGEDKIISLRGFSNMPTPNFEGFCYRRDWIAKYGTHPVTGESFTGGFTDPDDYESWEDNVVFPNGTDEPIYISDWEWMFDIFVKAMEAEGIEDGYCFAPFYMGYMQTGDLYTGFGGGAPYWYMDGDTVVNGVTNDNMRAYLQCLNTWYNKGWLDEAFDEHTGDMFFAIDTASVFQGEVGLWQGRSSTVGIQIRTEGTYSQDAVVYGCRQPINDIYGGDAQKNVEPNYMYQYTRAASAVAFMDTMTEDEIIAVLQLADWTYTPDGALIGNAGLNAEQVSQITSDFIVEYGLEDGYYTLEEVDGKRVAYTKYSMSDTISPATDLTRFSLRYTEIGLRDYGFDRYNQQAVDAWDYYLCTANVPEKVFQTLTAEQNQTVTKIGASLNQFQQRTIPAIIKGEAYDLWDDASWEKFCNDINKYRADEITQIYQEVYDSLK